MVFNSESGTPSGTASDTPSCTKIVGELAEIISTASDGKIKDMGYAFSHGIQLMIL